MFTLLISRFSHSLKVSSVLNLRYRSRLRYEICHHKLEKGTTMVDPGHDQKIGVGTWY